MAKVMLVEDDNNLREIYVARLAAEGYETASAHDGEEALALAVKEKPDLIISDVMMPKISGFDMLDILRSTPETKNTKVIMMTALSQAEDRERADKLGADRYLVKSQVTLEDVIKVAHEVLEDDGAAPAAASAAPTAEPTTASPAPELKPEPKDEPNDEPTTDKPTESPAVAPDPTPAPSLDPTPVPAPDPVPEPADEPKADPAPAPAVEPAPAEPPSTPAPEPDNKPDKPIADVAAATAPAPTVIEPTSIPVSSDDDKEEAAGVKTEAEATNDVEKQIKDFVDNSPELNSPSTTKEAPQITTSPNSIPISTPDENEPASKADEPAKTSAPASVAENNSVIGEPPSHKKLVLEPTGNATKPTIDLDALLAKEDAKEASSTPQTNDVIQPSAASSADATPDSSGQPSDQLTDKLSDISL